MEKNKKIILLVSILIMGVGVSLSYFISKTMFNGSGSSSEVRTATVGGSTLDVKGNILFDDLDVYPGHETLSKITVIATGNNELINYNLIWKGTNNLNTTLKYRVYKSKEDLNLNITCNKKKKVEKGKQYLNEECNEEEILSNLELISNGEIEQTTEEKVVTITPNQFITASKDGTKEYYYVVIEYPNLQDNQNKDIGLSFTGKVYGEISKDKADINIIAAYKETGEGTGKYEPTEEIPQEGYVLNQTETHCNNENVKVRIENKEIILSNVTQSGTSCYLYFDVETSFSDLPVKIKKEVKGTITVVTGPSCDGDKGGTCSDGDSKTNNMAENGIYAAEDDFGTSYFYRGTVDNNWVKFGQMKSGADTGKDIWWRIIRINGNGTIRMIYAGLTDAGSKTAPDTTGNETQINGKTYSFNSAASDNAYIGYMYGARNSLKYETTHTNDNDSTIKTEVDNWYKITNLSTLLSKIDVETGFCNDRNVAASAHDSWGTNGYDEEQTVYAPYHRTHNSSTSFDTEQQEPTLICGTPKRDLFTGPDAQRDGKILGNNKLNSPLGLITADEVLYAGGFGGQANNKYWLYTNQDYWTFSSFYFQPGVSGLSSARAFVFEVRNTGWLDGNPVHVTKGVRPVINLKTNVTFKAGGNGTSTNPYIVE